MCGEKLAITSVKEAHTQYTVFQNVLNGNLNLNRFVKIPLMLILSYMYIPDLLLGSLKSNLLSKTTLLFCGDTVIYTIGIVVRSQYDSWERGKKPNWS